MALTPISMFQPQGSGIAQFLQGGSAALASALNNVIQVGRDTANKQFAQERDFLGEQKRVEDLMQRRGEVAQQQQNFERTFARNLFVSDRDFADRNADQARAEERMRAEDLFRRSDADRNYELRKSEAESLQKSREMAITEAERQQQEREQQEQFKKEILESPGVLPPRPDAEPSLTAGFLYGPTGARSMETGPSVAPMTPEERLADADIRMKAAENKDAAAYRKAAQDKAKAEAEIQKRTLTSEERTQERFRMAQRSEQRILEKAEATKAAEAAKIERAQATAQIEGLLTDFKAFPPAQSFIPEGLTKEQKAAAQAEAEVTDANRAMVEVQAALDSPTFEDYLIKSVASHEKRGEKWDELTRDEKLAKAKSLGEAVVKKRKKLWELARKTGLGGNAAPAAASPVQQEIDRLRGGAGKLAD